MIAAQAGSKTLAISARLALATVSSVNSLLPHARCASPARPHPTLTLCPCVASARAQVVRSLTLRQRSARLVSRLATLAQASSSARVATARTLPTPTSSSMLKRADASRTAQRHLFLPQTKNVSHARHPA